jgi:hypothetical protein
MKPCIKCGEVKPLSGFYPNRRMRDGHINVCKPCSNAYSRANGKQWRETHKANLRTNRLKWEQRHAEEIALARAIKRDGRLTPEEQAVHHRERKLWQRQEWAKRHPELDLAYRRRESMRRYANKRDAQGTASMKQIEARWDFYGRRCWMCGAPATETDHVFPLRRGGSDWPANQRPACTPCNRSKAALVMDLSEIAVFTRLALTA